MIFAASKLQVLPSPWQVSQAPNGLLKENDRGSSCGMLVPQFGAGQFLRVKLFFPVYDRDGDQPVRQLASGFDRGFQAFFRTGLQWQTIDDYFDGVVLALVERDFFVERAKRAVHAGAHESLAEEFFEILFVFALAAAYDRREDHDALAFGQRQDLLQDLFGRLARNLDAAGGAVRYADGGVEDAQIIVDFGDGADRGARAAVGGLLFDGDGGAQTVDGIHFGAFHLIEELARVGRERFHVAALALGVDGVEGERGFAGAAQARDHREGVARDFDVDIFEIVLASAVHGDALKHLSGENSILAVGRARLE